MKKIVSLGLFVAMNFGFSACKPRKFNDGLSAAKNLESGSNEALNQGYDSRLLATFNNQIYSTFIIADSLIGNKESFARLCNELVAEKYNLVFVNVQARGYYMGRPGLKLTYAPGKTQLMPGDPRMQVNSPIHELRSRCGDKIKFVPWLEYGARAELLVDSKMLGLNGDGYTENENEPSKVIRVNPAVINGVQKSMFYPAGWYLLNSSTGSIYTDQDGKAKKGIAAYWLDIRNPEVQGFLMSFNEKLAEMYGPLIDWDRVRFPQWAYQLDSKTNQRVPPIPNISPSEYEEQNNPETRFFREVGRRLQARKGALWVTVAKPAVTSANARGSYLNDEFGQHWFTWGDFAQLIVPMTYWNNTQQFDADLNFIDDLSKKNSFKYLPIVGVDANYKEFSKKPEYENLGTALEIETRKKNRLANELNLISVGDIANPNKVGAAYWFHCFEPIENASTKACD